MDRNTKVSLLLHLRGERDMELLRRALDARLPAPLEREVLAVGERVGSAARALLADRGGRLLERRGGRGDALRAAIAEASGELLIIPGPDPSCLPADLEPLLAPILAGQADASCAPRARLPAADRLVAAGLRLLSGVPGSDPAGGCRAALASFVKSLPLRCSGTGVDAELAMKLARRGCRSAQAPAAGPGVRAPEAAPLLPALAAACAFGLVDDLYGEDRIGRDILGQLEKTTRFNAWLADAVRPHLRGRVLETGAGIGNICAELCGAGPYTATDVDEESLRYMRLRFLRRPNVRVARLDLARAEDFAALDERPDTIVCLNVLEHLAEDEAVLRALRAALAPRGRLVLLVPQGAWAYGTLDEALGHVRRYARAELLAKVRAAGFEPLEDFEFNRASLPGWLLNGKLLRRRRFGRVQLKLFDSMVWLWRRLDRALPWPGQSLVVVARTT
ncbi:MAG TPA: methyltransferase [Elusimicrobiota bacterium]|nr:methyltransferase [Elusimicrobiota bacterium]